MSSLNLILADDLTVEVFFDYWPGEAAVMYPNDKAHPGCDEEIEVTAVIVKNDEGREVDLIDVLNQEAINQLAADALQELHDLEADR